MAPTYDLAEKVFREIVGIASASLPHNIVVLKENEKRLVLRNLAGGLSEIRAKSADSPVSLLGEGLDWVIVDEAARLKPLVWESHLSQRLIDRRGWALLISTPRGKGWFYDLFRRGQPEAEDPAYESWNHPSWTNPYLKRELIESERGRIPERVFRQEYGAQFLEGAGQVFRNVRDAASGEWEEPKEGMAYHAGLDLASTPTASASGSFAAVPPRTPGRRSPSVSSAAPSEAVVPSSPFSPPSLPATSGAPGRPSVR